MKVKDWFAVSAKFWNWPEENAVCLIAVVCTLMYHTKHVDVFWLFTVYAKGHKFHWTSSSQINNDNGVKLYEDNLLFAMGVVLSGNNYSKLEQYCKILEIQTISRTTFHMYQRLYICPGINKFYCRKQVILFL